MITTLRAFATGIRKLKTFQENFTGENYLKTILETLFNQCVIVSPAVRPADTGEYVLSGARSLTLLRAALGLACFER